jgi:hypothetical protein
MNFKRMLTTPLGQFLISVIMGLGLATMFRRVCDSKNCILFNGPVISEIDGKIYKFDEYCYKYELNTVKCNSAKKTVALSNPEKDKE